MDNEAENSFDRLVSGLTSEERHSMLEKMKAKAPDSEVQSLVQPESVKNRIEFDTEIPLSGLIKQESFFRRIFWWLKSIIKNTSIEEIYNEYRVSGIAKEVERNNINILDSKRQFLLPDFYEKLMQLKSSADFFRHFLNQVDNDESNFLVFLGSIVMENVENRMNMEVDPYSIPLENGPRVEQRSALLKKMDEVIAEISPDEKSRMYKSVCAVEWLRQFVKLPFQRFLSLFTTVVEGNYSCPFSSIGSEVAVFARVLFNGVKITHESLEAIYLFSEKRLSHSLDSVDESIQRAGEYMEKAKSHISLIKMFINTVPLHSIGCVVYNDSRWLPDNFTGGEDWFGKFKAAWKKLFDQKWKSWSLDCRKEVLRTDLTKNFALEEFPLLPYRPWQNIKGCIPFKYELTAGFINWYFDEEFPRHEITLKTVMLEGDFSNKENRQEFAEAFNSLIQISIDIHNLTVNLSSRGDLGSIFIHIEKERIRSLQEQSRIEAIVHSVESDVRSMLMQFGDSYRILDLCFSGIFHENRDSRYDGLSNIERISAKNNEKFREGLAKARESLRNAYSFVIELEPLDSPPV